LAVLLIDDLDRIESGVALHLAGNGHIQASYRNAIRLACGSCLRTPEHARILAGFFVKHFSDGGTNYRDWFQAMQAILRYRPEASRCFDPNDCEAIAALCSQRFRDELVQSQNGDTPRSLLFKYAANVLLFLLRRRAFDPMFLDPESELAQQIKRTCISIIEIIEIHQSAIRNGEGAIGWHKRIIKAFTGGAIEAGSIEERERLERQAIQQIIDYIDRRGVGLPIIAVPSEETDHT
jgi:hypothetical protein